MSFPIISTLEAGGTKMVAGLASGPGQILERKRIPTTSPEETIAALVSFFQKHAQAEALAVGTFGPADINPASATYGFITDTPKSGWQNTNLLGPLHDALGVPAIFDTDVNAALFGEAKWGAAKGVDHAAYFTIGTGIGGAVMIDGQLIHGMGHTEMGHMRVRRHDDDSYEGGCPFHQDCLEGLASGPALEKRWGISAKDLPVDHPAWEIEADYLAQACLNVLTIAPPQKIILGGGVMHQKHLFPLVNERLKKHLHHYLKIPDDFIVPPALGDDAGLLGCVSLGHQLLNS
ncbi:MAG: ROK family protein [Akkermansiaceae bacterium]